MVSRTRPALTLVFQNHINHVMMTSSNGNIFRFTGHFVRGNHPDCLVLEQNVRKAFALGSSINPFLGTYILGLNFIDFCDYVTRIFAYRFTNMIFQKYLKLIILRTATFMIMLLDKSILYIHHSPKVMADFFTHKYRHDAPIQFTWFLWMYRTYVSSYLL